MTTRRQWCGGLLLIVVVAALLRLWMPGPTIRTVDEGNWMKRSGNFHRAVAEADFASTVAAPRGTPATRPGVTTMWIGAFAAKSLDYVDGDRLRRSHQFVGVVCTLWLIPFVGGCRRLVGRRAALISGGVLAVEPLLVGHSALLHTDALMTMSSGTAVVAALVAFESLRREGQVDGPPAWWRRASTRWIALAGVSAAFAVLTKVTAVAVLGPLVPALVVVHLLSRRRAGGEADTEPWSEVLGRLGVVLATGVGVAGVVAVAAWPALWVAPVSAVGGTVDSIGLADQAYSRLFLGDVIVGADWRYYPVEAFFRTSPWIFVVTIAAVITTVARVVQRRPRLLPRRVSLGLLAATVPYLVVISVSDKQYARYLLPVLPVAAVALAVVVERWLERAGRRTATIVPWATFALAASWTASLAPYQVSHVNPLVGGQRAAETRIPLGWGEGMEQIGVGYPVPDPCPSYSAGTGGWKWHYLEQHGCVREAAWWLIGDGPPPELYLRYVYNRQRGEEPPALEPYLHEHGTLEYTVTIDGVHYVEVWRLAAPSP